MYSANVRVLVLLLINISVKGASSFLFFLYQLCIHYTYTRTAQVNASFRDGGALVLLKLAHQQIYISVTSTEYTMQ